MTEGELWVREELGKLLAARFSPVAVARFLLASQRRAGEIRAARPDLARQELQWIAAGYVALLVARRGRGFGWWTMCALMLDWHLGMLETEDGEPRPMSAADALTLARAWLVPVAWDAPSAPVCAAASFTDVFDGIVARRYAVPTRAGRDLEGLVDACFAVAALRGALAQGWLGRRAGQLEIARLLVGTAYAFAVYFGRAQAPSPAITRAARLTSQARVPGLVAAALGRRRAADALVAGGSVASLLVLVRALSRRTAPTSPDRTTG